jgi:hypothetical protein
MGATGKDMLIGRRKPLTAAQQFVNLRVNPVCHGGGELRAGRFTWRFSATPSPIGRDYNIRIEFEQDGRPEIFVDVPDLHVLAKGRRIPHLYQQKPPRLCLYLPKTCEWQSWMRLDQTIVPWVTLWLFYFEEWLASDEWKGGGMHPKGDDDREQAA